MPKEQKNRDLDQELIKKFIRYTSIPFEFLASIGGGALIGYWLDKLLHTQYWLTFSLAILGFFSTLYQIIKSLKK